MRILLRLVKYALARRALYIGTAVVMGASVVPIALIPRLAGDAIDEALTGGQRELFLIAGQIALAGVFRAVLDYFALYLAEKVGRVTEYRLRNDFFDKLQSLNFGFYDRQKTGDLMSRATVDIGVMSWFTSTSLHLVAVVVLYTVPIALMIGIEWRLGLAVLVCFALIAALGIRLAFRLYVVYREALRETGRMNAVAHESMTGMRTVKVLGARDYEAERFRERAGAAAANFIVADQLFVTRDAVLTFLFAIVIAGTLLFGGWQVQQGSMTPGALASFVLYMVLLSASIGTMERMVQLFSRAAAAGERVFEILDAQSPLGVPENARDLSPRGRVAFDSVSFEYGEDVPALHDVSFELQPGQSAAIVGGAGSGKSTIAHLLPRFYDTSAGRVLIDGVDVREITLESLRRSVGIVLQDAFAFSATIRDNIAYGVDDASMDDVERAAKAAQLHGFIEGLPDGYETWVGERGVTLSGGQRQRLAIARTILLDTPILVLDDSTSSVDTATEALIHRAMEDVMRDRTSFVIAHRLSTVRSADMVLVLDRGRVVEQGSHDDLMRMGGFYRRIHDLQLRPADEMRGLNA